MARGPVPLPPGDGFGSGFGFKQANDVGNLSEVLPLWHPDRPDGDTGCSDRGLVTGLSGRSHQRRLPSVPSQRGPGQPATVALTRELGRQFALCPRCPRSSVCPTSCSEWTWRLAGQWSLKTQCVLLTGAAIGASVPDVHAWGRAGPGRAGRWCSVPFCGLRHSSVGHVGSLLSPGSCCGSPESAGELGTGGGWLRHLGTLHAGFSGSCPHPRRRPPSRQLPFSGPAVGERTCSLWVPKRCRNADFFCLCRAKHVPCTL